MPRWQRSTASIRLRAAAASDADDVQIDAERLADHAARVDDVRSARRARSRSAARAGRRGRGARSWLLAASRTRCTSPSLTGCRGRRPAASKCSRAEPSAGQVDDHRLDLDLRHPLGRVDGLADRAFGGLEIDDRRRPSARASAGGRCRGCAPGGCGRAACRGSPSAGQLGDEADDLARADVEHGQDRALARRQRLQAWRQAVAQEAHVSTPLPRIGFFLSASARAAAASSVSRTTTRSGMRRSIAITSFSQDASARARA